MQEIAQLPVKTKLALFLSLSVTMLFAFIFVQQAVGFTNNTIISITPPVTPPNTASPSPSGSPTTTPSATPTPSPSASPSPSVSPTPTPALNTPPQIKLLLGNTIQTRVRKNLTWTFLAMDSNRDVVQVVGSQLPPGLSLTCKKDGKKRFIKICKIKGKPTRVGTTSVTLTATDSKSGTDTETIQIIVTPKK